MPNEPKFPDCRRCRWFSRRAEPPICGECDVGEMFEERIRDLTEVRTVSIHDLREVSDDETVQVLTENEIAFLFKDTDDAE